MMFGHIEECCVSVIDVFFTFLTVIFIYLCSTECRRMSIVHQNMEKLSVKLSEVLSDIGINDDIIMKRRTHNLFKEAANSIDELQTDDGALLYYFGSQSEGATTLGIQSDADVLCCSKLYHVVPDLADWKHGVTNVLMVQDASTAAGYCLLQLLKDDTPLAADNVPTEVYCLDDKQRVLLKNSVFEDDFRHIGVARHGPAGYRPADVHQVELDFVVALRCAQWPKEARHWLSRPGRSGWPSARLKSECESSGCLLVPVGSKIKGLDDLEWRISTSFAERYLMFSLNVTQMGCYVLMKMLLKSNPVFHDVITSYMCKTALFHCIENTDSVVWQEHNLLLCLNETLRVLCNFVYSKNCPHFIIPENNLMAGRISEEQRRDLMSVLEDIIKSNGKVFLEVQIDDLAERLGVKLNRIEVLPRHIHSAVIIREFISGNLCILSATLIADYYRFQLLKNNDSALESIRYFLDIYSRCNKHQKHFTLFQQKACSYIEPLLCTVIGSLQATHCTASNIPMPDSVKTWL